VEVAEGYGIWYPAQTMIVKEKSVCETPKDRLLAAGEAAERTMAHYLRRKLEKPIGGGLVSKPFEVRIFNDLRVVLGETPDGREDAVQIDHLVMHPWGMVIVESKSVCEEVSINAKGEFKRRYQGAWLGMPSPVAQARRQGEGLRNLLIEHKDELRDRKVLGLVQGGFKACPIDVIVAVSDKGNIRREKCEAPEVMKADLVVGRILEIIERHRKGSRLLSKTDEHESGLWSMTDEEAEKITAFLLERHVEGGRREARGASGGEARVAAQGGGEPVAREALTCGKCRSINVQMVSARYGYCLKCDECGKFTPVDSACRACGKKARIAKRGLEFRRVCEGEGGCGTERVFFVNRG
jgi:hypothetical protein